MDRTAIDREEGSRSHVSGSGYQVNFQFGSKSRYGKNGCTVQDILNVCHTRLSGYQGTANACEETEEAIYLIREAIDTLNARAKRRSQAGLNSATGEPDQKLAAKVVAQQKAEAEKEAKAKAAAEKKAAAAEKKREEETAAAAASAKPEADGK